MVSPWSVTFFSELQDETKRIWCEGSSSMLIYIPTFL
jgi:hypothetical protein